MDDKVLNYLKRIISISVTDTHGYSMINRWGNPDYDCSSLVISVVDESGIPVRKYGATYTGNMLEAFIRAGFKDVTKEVDLKTGVGLVVGDILLNTVHHTEIYTAPNEVTGAHWDYDGKAGDSSGMEICSKPYYNYPWHYVLRYHTKESDNPITYTMAEIITAIECINGQYGIGEERKDSLTNKGFDYLKIQNLINHIVALIW